MFSNGGYRPVALPGKPRQNAHIERFCAMPSACPHESTTGKLAQLNQRDRERIVRNCLSGIYLAVALLLTAVPSAWADDALIERGYERAPTTSGSPATADQIERAIEDAAAWQKWRVLSAEPGRIELQFNPGAYYMTVEARYNEGGFELKYLASQNLSYKEKNGKRTIHRNYNVRVGRLADQIHKSVLTPGRPVTADTIWISAVIPYRNEIPPDSGYAQCNWNRELSEHIVRRSRGTIQATDKDLATLPGKTLRIQIRYVHSAAGGGAISGPKWGKIRADLYKDGQLLGRFDQQRVTVAVFAGYCGALSRIAAALGADVSVWLRRGVFTVPEQDETEDDETDEIPSDPDSLIND
jgi:hypothetical protein